VRTPQHLFRRLAATILGLWLASSAAIVHGEALSDAEVRQRIIQQSIASYPGSCPCPFNTARNGSRCGRRSAYSRAGGYSVLCFDSDVSDDAVARYRKQHGIAAPK